MRRSVFSSAMHEPPDTPVDEAFLIDFGAGRRLEKLGGILVDRPLPQARLPKKLPALWGAATVRYSVLAGRETRLAGRETGRVAGAHGAGQERGQWEFSGPLPDPWQIELPLHPDRLLLEVRPAPSGQTGLFLEQLGQWQWLRRVTPQGARVLSLFAHSGAASLALAAAGAEVVHVDASSQAVALARRNAEASHLAHAPIRWVCEDAHTFVARQLRRGERFDGVVLDPPSWGHGPKGQAFAIDRDLLPLLEDVAALVAGSGSPPQASPAGPILLSCHSSGWHPRRLHDTLADSFAACVSNRNIEAGELTSRDASGRLLAQGAFARIEPAA